MDETGKPIVYVTAFMDYVCPFCFIGDLRLERLREEFALRVNWRLVEIHPETPEQGQPVGELGYGPEQWRAMMANLDSMAAAEGITLAARERAANSHYALLLAEAAKDDGAEAFYPLHRRLFRAYFVEGRDIGDRDTLTELAREAGLADSTRERAWTEPDYADRLQANLAAARRAGVTGTPTFLIGDRRLAGALPTEHLLQAAREAAQ